jgi:hypothetical protein
MIKKCLQSLWFGVCLWGLIWQLRESSQINDDNWMKADRH